MLLLLLLFMPVNFSAISTLAFLYSLTSILFRHHVIIALILGFWQVLSLFLILSVWCLLILFFNLWFQRFLILWCLLCLYFVFLLWRFFSFSGYILPFCTRMSLWGVTSRSEVDPPVPALEE